MSRATKLFLMAAFAVSVMASCWVSTAGAETSSVLRWNRCEHSGSGKFQSNECLYQGSGGWESVPLAGGVGVALASNQIPLTFAIPINGPSSPKLEVACVAEDAGSSLENPVGSSSNGVGKLEIEYSVCALEEYPSCRIKAVAEQDKIELFASEGKDEVKLAPKSGTQFVEFEISLCSALNGKYVVRGETNGLMNNNVAELEFGEATKSELKYAGNAVPFSAKVPVEDESGAYFSAKPLSSLPAGSWYACTKQSGGKYKNSECNAEGSPSEWEAVRLQEGESTGIDATSKAFKISSEAIGVKITLECEGERAASSLENPLGAGAGTGTLEVRYKGCVAIGSAWAGCVVKATTVHPYKAELVTPEGKSEVKLKASEGNTVTEFHFSECTSKLLNQVFKLTLPSEGLRGTYNNSTSEIEVNESEIKQLKFAGNKASAGATAIGLETTGGAHILGR
jgi:hypothetical protein